MSLLTTVLIIALLALLVAALPTWPHSRGWGYTPGAVVAFPLAVLLALWLLGVL